MMTARGFGKRRVQIGANARGSSDTSGSKHMIEDAPWGYDKREAGKLIEELTSDNFDSVQPIMSEQESFPLDWFANEMSTNPNLARTILQRFVDNNKDGILTTNELFSPGVSDRNDLF